jgi:hypothetical protein
VIFQNRKKENFMKLQETSKHLLLSLFIALVLGLTVYSTKAQAQIIGDMEADIPFQFHAGNTKFPAGKYIIHLLDNSDQAVMEIRSADGTSSTLFDVRPAVANAEPAKSELIFNKYGDRYFLTKLFEEGVADGSDVLESRYEKRVAQAAAEGQERVPAHRRVQQGN